MKYLYQDKEWLIKQYQQGKEIRQIAKEIKCSTASIVLANRNFGISATDYNPKYLYKNEDWLKIQFDKYETLTNVAKQTGLPRTCISRYATKFGIRDINYNRPVSYDVDENFFDIIDTENKAYWLGMLMADGWITLNKEGRYRLGLKLQSKDKFHIEKFAKDIRYAGPIRDKVDTARGKSNKANTIEINNQTFCNHAIKNSICRNKSGKEVIPKTVPDHLIKHFVRGFLDGDGCITGNIGFKKRAQISFVGMSTVMMEEIKFTFQKFLGIEMHIYHYKSHPFEDGKACSDMCSCYTYKNDNIYKILKWLYEGATVYLDRKYKKANNVINQYIEYRARKKPC